RRSTDSHSGTWTAPGATTLRSRRNRPSEDGGSPGTTAQPAPPSIPSSSLFRSSPPAYPRSAPSAPITR
ncbi:hypothetical protein GA0115261_116781, partial [Streptomyces sp. OspMP-M43]